MNKHLFESESELEAEYTPSANIFDLTQIKQEA